MLILVMISINLPPKKTVGAPHKKYKKINFPKNKILIDIWGFY